ncbi:hypothetical protein [Acidovorax sp.]|uniref:hypothetical protein n=1 Tax=Acidovorax sp. TaxID=1872122 RepID=UPI003D0652F0
MATHVSDSPADSAASPSSAAGSAVPLIDEVRAGALWAFIKSQAPRFTREHALEVIQSMPIDPHEDFKTLAKRLRTALQLRGIALKQVNALHAAAQLRGHSSWHSDKGETTPRLRFYIFESSLEIRESNVPSWSELAVSLRTWVDQLLADGKLPLGVLAMSFIGRALHFSIPMPKQGEGATPGINELQPAGGIFPIAADDLNWLNDAPVALEKLRRHLEETGKAVLDGYAALYLCANSHDRAGDFNAVSPSDVVNSELVLLFEPDEDDPHSGYEIARGDELTCWHQLELSRRRGRDGFQPERVDVTIPQEGGGAWFVGGERYVWALETLKPHEYVPGRIHRQLGIPECERLLRRYKLARSIHSGGFRHHDMTKRVDYLNELPETWRVDLHNVLHILKEACLTWDSYIEMFDADVLPMAPVLPVGFVMKMLEDLEVNKPNNVFAWPTLADMELVTDDKLLYSLMPRVQAVRYAKPGDLDPERAASLREAVDEFASGLQMQKAFGSGAIAMKDELPYLVYASDAQEMRLSADALGLAMYVAVLPHLYSTKGLLPEIPGVKTWPWALGHALALRFEHAGGVA